MKFPLRFLRAVVCALALTALLPAQVFAQRVLILVSEEPSMQVALVNDVRSKLLATAKLVEVDVIDVSTSTPALADLVAYDAVMTWPNVANADPDALGNVLADYVDLGHGVVQALFSFAEDMPGARLGGRWAAEGYEVFNIGPTNMADLTMTPDLPEHPMLDGVNSLALSLGFFQTGIVVAPCAEVVAHWTSDEFSEPVAAWCPGTRGGRVVALNLYPPSTDAYPFAWLSNTDGAVLMANALVFAGSAPPVADQTESEPEPDTTAPVLANVPASLVSATATSASGAYVGYGPITAEDAVDGPVSVSCSQSGQFPVGDTLVTCSASDASGNTANATFTVRVLDVKTSGVMWGKGSIRVGSLRYDIEFAVGEVKGYQGALLQVRAKDDQPRTSDSRFSSRKADFVAFSNDPAVRPGTTRVDTVLFSGVGDWNGRSGYQFNASVVDKGERGRSRLVIQLTITAPDGAVVARVDGTMASCGSTLRRLVRR